MVEIFHKGEILDAKLHTPGSGGAAVVDGGSQQTVTVKIDAGSIKGSAVIHREHAAAFLGIRIIAGGIPAPHEGRNRVGVHFRAKSGIPALALRGVIRVIAAVDEITRDLEGREHAQFGADTRPIHGGAGICGRTVAHHIHIAGFSDAVAVSVQADHAPGRELEVI